MWCLYCRQESHATWCPVPIAESENQDMRAPLATGYWGRGLLMALGVKAPTTQQIEMARGAFVALHRYANAEGIATARRHIPNHEDYKEDELHPLLKSISENVAGAHAEALHVGVELPVGQAQAPAPIAKKV